MSCRLLILWGVGVSASRIGSRIDSFEVQGAFVSSSCSGFYRIAIVPQTKDPPSRTNKP